MAEEFWIFTNVQSAFVGPKNFNGRLMFEIKGDIWTISPNSFKLLCPGPHLGKFSHLEKGVDDLSWKINICKVGFNCGYHALRAEMVGVLLWGFQIIPRFQPGFVRERELHRYFFEADEEFEVSHADKKGKCQKQQRIVLPKI